MRAIRLSIMEEHWNGWLATSPKVVRLWHRLRWLRPRTRKVLLTENDPLVLQAAYVLQITVCQDDELEIRPLGHPLSSYHPQTGGIDLWGSLGPTRLHPGQSVWMATPTMDVGTIWKITLLDISAQEC